jgi:iron complex outermembrane receptor protein
MASASAMCMLFALPVTAAFAQTAAPAGQPAPAKPAGSGTKIEDVVVTARKRSEKLLQVPISITALTAKALQDRAVYSITDIADQTPGLTIDSAVGGSGRSDRSFPEYVIRGMPPSVTTNPTTTVFVDGAPLISGAIEGIDVDDLARVEVLKGPQSAYFGRETFAGAIDLVTKDPSNVPTATVEALAASPNYYDERLTLEGPLVPDILTARGSYRFYSRQGSYDNEAVADKTSQHLGDQSTQSGNLEFVLTPNEDVKIKALGMYWRDDDGPSAQELIEPSQSNCLGFWFCGQVPGRLATQPAANDLVTPAISRLLAYLGTPAAQQAFKPLNDGYGLVREGYHASVNADYHIAAIDSTVTSLSAIDGNRFSELQDLANDDGSSFPNIAYTYGEPFANKYYDFPFFVEDGYRSISEELRLASAQDQRFRWLIGFNYEWSRVDSSLGGGSGFDYFVGDSPDVSSTYGVFYGLSFDILKNLTMSAEGRYQIDDESTTVAGTSLAAPGGPTIAQTYRDFTPRFSLRYQATPDLMAYATYSEGVNPGTFNGSILDLSPTEQQTLARDFGATVKVQPEHLVNYEIGVKAKLLDDSLTVAADVYDDIWYNQINIETLNFLVGQTVEETTADLNNGKIHLRGLEVDLNWEPVPHLLINASGAINVSEIVSGGCYTCLERIGTQDVNGKQLPNVSRYQATAGAQYSNDFAALAGTMLDALSSWSWFARADYVYKSRSFEDKDNLVWTPDENLVNLRAGVTHGNLRLEGFVDNLTNWGGPSSLSAIVNLGNPFETYVHQNDALVGALPFLRTYGVRLIYKFGIPPAAPPESGHVPVPPAPPPPAAQAVRTYLVFFDWDRADLSARARQIVQQAASASLAGGITKLEVDGYTDTSGTVAYNRALSVRRAQTVKTELVRDGVPAAEITISGRGESDPLVPTGPGVREPQNRRVQIILG